MGSPPTEGPKPIDEKDAKAPCNGWGTPPEPRLKPWPMTNSYPLTGVTPSPKGWEILAQGNALGDGCGKTRSPERAQYRRRRARLRRPFRAYTTVAEVTQGVALG